MPNPKVLAEKQAIVEELTGKLRSLSGVLVDYAGITVAEDTEMRARMRAEDVEYSVVKNTLMRFAIKNVGFEALDPILNGTTSLALHKTDAVAPARIVKEYSGKLGERFTIKAGFYDGQVLTAAEVEELAAIPAFPVLRAQLLGTMLAPISQLALVLKLIAEKGGAPAETAAEETPVAEVAAVEEAAPAVEAVEEVPATEAEAVEAAPEAVEETAAPEADAPAVDAETTE